MLCLGRYHHYLESHVYINLEKTPRQENAQTIETQKEDAKTCFSETARLATNTPWIMSNKQPARWSGAAKMFGNPGKRQRQERQRRWPKKEDEDAWQKTKRTHFHLQTHIIWHHIHLLLDREDCWIRRIDLHRSASMHPRTSPEKFAAQAREP